MLWGGGRLLVAFSIPLLSSWFIASSVIVPTIIPNASATESTDKNTSTSTTDKGYSLSISVPKTVTIDLIPNPSGSFSYSELNTQVTTTNPTGYILSFNASDNSLINTNTNITTNNTIPSITNDTNQSSFPTNSWGYSINDNNNEITTLTFKPIPLPSSSTQDKQLKVTNLADNSTTPTTNTNTKLILGIKANNSLASGTYAGQLTFTSVANYVATFWELTTMQDMTSYGCSSVVTPSKNATTSVTTEAAYTNSNTQVPERTLTDSRDGNTYVIRKLADGNCWMVQNLRLGTNPDGSAITSPITLSSTDSNIASGTFTLTTSSNSFGTTDDAAGINIVRMHDNGNAYINDNYSSNTQTVSTTGLPTSQTNYLGNYYNWYTATAGTGTYEMGTQNTNTTSSICPKGWRLPKGGAINASTGNGEFQTLYDTYSLTDDITGSTKFRRPPISAVLSGNWATTSVSNQGSGGYWWSSTIYDNIASYSLRFYTSSILPQRNNGKSLGFSMRCLAE